MQPIPGPTGLYRIFYTVTGVGFLTLLYGFGQCLFDLDKVGECADHAVYATGVLKEFGDHVITWCIAFVQEVLSRQA